MFKQNLSFIKKYFVYLYPYAGQELLLLLLMIITSLTSLVSPYVLKVIIDKIFPHGDYKDLILILLLLLVTYIIRVTFSVCIEILYTKISTNIISAIRTDMLKSILNQPLFFFKTKKTADILFSVMNDVQTIQSALSALILSCLTDFLTVIGIIVMLCVLNAHLALICLSIIPLIILSIRKFTPHIQAKFKQLQEQQEIINNFFFERIKNIRVIKSYNTYKNEAEKLSEHQVKSVKIAISNSLVNSLNTNITIFLIALGPILVLIYAGKNIFEGLMTLGSLIAFIQYLNRIYSPAINIMNSYNSFNKALVSMKRVDEYIMINPLGDILTNNRPKFSSVSFNHVSLSLNEKQILNNVNLKFEKGKIYGITGESGSGKTSILNLLCGFFHPTEGQILLDGQIDIRTVANWNSVLGVIEKENQLFNETVNENIRYGSFHSSKTQVNTAIKHSELSKVIENLPFGLHTFINDCGSFLSDGQKQRISIARALLYDADIILFDEATSQLDIPLEKIIFDNIKKYYSHAIVINITHRLQSLNYCDYVFYVEKGTVLKEGEAKYVLNF